MTVFDATTSKGRPFGHERVGHGAGHDTPLRQWRCRCPAASATESKPQALATSRTAPQDWAGFQLVRRGGGGGGLDTALWLDLLPKKRLN